MKITPEFLAAAEKLARGAIIANADAKVPDGVMRPGRTVVLVEPENQIAMVTRIRLLSDMLERAIGFLESTSDAAHRKHVARQLRIELAQ